MHVEGFDFVEEKNLLPQNMSLWQKDYLELFIFKKEQTQENLKMVDTKKHISCEP